MIAVPATGAADTTSAPGGTGPGPVLHHAGRVGTGFTDAMLDQLLATLRPLERITPPVVDPPRGAAGRDIHWVEPELVGEVTYTEWTTTRSLRHPVWRGLRPDKSPAEVDPV